MNILRAFQTSKPPMHLCTIFDIPVKISAAWCWMVLIFALVALIGSGVIGAIAIILFIFAAYFFVLVHEFGHALTAQHYGIKCEAIYLYPFAGLASIDVRHDAPIKEFWITFNGPLTNFVWCVLFFGVRDLQIFSLMFTLNLMMLLFNLIPVHPMDGGRIYRSLLQIVFKIKPLDAAKYTYYTGLIVGVPIAILAFVMGWWIAAFLLIVAAIFMGKQEYKRVQARHAIDQMQAGFRDNPLNYTRETRDLVQQGNDAINRVDDLLQRTRRYGG